MDNNAYVGRYLAASAKILAHDADNNPPICDAILASLQGGTPHVAIQGYQAALVFCHAMFAKVKTMTPSLERLVGALRKYNEISGALEYQIPFPPNLSWSRFQRDLGIEDPEVLSHYSNYRTPSSSFAIVDAPNPNASNSSLSWSHGC